MILEHEKDVQYSIFENTLGSGHTSLDGQPKEEGASQGETSSESNKKRGW